MSQHFLSFQDPILLEDMDNKSETNQEEVTMCSISTPKMLSLGQVTLVFFDLKILRKTSTALSKLSTTPNANTSECLGGFGMDREQEKGSSAILPSIPRNFLASEEASHTPSPGQTPLLPSLLLPRSERGPEQERKCDREERWARVPLAQGEGGLVDRPAQGRVEQAWAN